MLESVEGIKSFTKVVKSRGRVSKYSIVMDKSSFMYFTLTSGDWNKSKPTELSVAFMVRYDKRNHENILYLSVDDMEMSIDKTDNLDDIYVYDVKSVDGYNIKIHKFDYSKDEVSFEMEIVK